MAFDLNNYVEVKDRIAEFYADHPGGSIRTFLVSREGKEVMFEARVYRTEDEARDGIYTSGFARELEGDGMVNKTSHVENCETSAIGRALANLDYCGSVGGSKAPRPSREEMGKAQRMGGGAKQNGGGNPWDKRMPFGKTKGTPLHEHTDEQLISTVEWCKDKGGFADLIADCEATLAHRGREVGA